MYSEKNIAIYPYNKKTLDSLEYIYQFFNIKLNPSKSFSPQLYILTTNPLLDDPIQKCKIIRSTDVETPIIIISETYDEIEAVTYFEFGADDYVSLPIKKGEFLARIKALMRRAYGIKNKVENAIKLGDITIYPESFAVYRAGIQTNLKISEIKTLIYLIKNENKIISREEIWKHLKVNAKRKIESRVIDVYISRLRNLLGLKPLDSSIPFHIRTVIGSGYVFEEEKQQSTV